MRETEPKSFWKFLFTRWYTYIIILLGVISTNSYDNQFLEALYTYHDYTFVVGVILGGLFMAVIVALIPYYWYRKKFRTS